MPELPPPVPHPAGVPGPSPVGPTTGDQATDRARPDRGLDEEAGGRIQRAALSVPRVGDLTTPWRAMMIATWGGVFLAFAAVWKASVEIGIRTWWIGPRSQPMPIVVQVIPFALAIAVALAATYNVRHLPWIGVAGALAIGIIAVFDVSRSWRLALVEAAIGVAALLVASGSFTGRYVRPTPVNDDDGGR